MDDAAQRPRILALIAIGLVGGTLSGMFGVGGGIILVPLLTTFAHLDQRRAAATSLLAILPSSIAGSITYLAHGEVDLLAAAIIAAGAIVGAMVGGRLLRRLPLAWLQWGFIALLLAVAVRLLFVVPVRGEPLQFSILVALAYLAIGLVMGIASGLFGVGGGFIAAPALVALLGVSDLIAKGTSLVAVIPTSVTGTATNSRTGLIDVRTALIVGLAAAGASVGGAFIALALPARLATIMFAVLILGIVVLLVIRALRSRKRD